jgi:Leucine-rich repeat (LRR) protein
MLWLNNCRLNSLPTWLDELNQLTLLNVRSNQLRDIPSSIGQLSNLNLLYLYENQISDLPTSLVDYLTE